MATDEGLKLFSGSKKRASLSLQADSARKRQHGHPAKQSEEPLTDGTAPAALQNGQALENAVAHVQAEAPMSFKALGLSDWLDKLCKSLGMTQPTEVQKGCIPSILKGRDVIGTAHTGSGKTAAFALPILQRLAQDPYGVYALVLTPTRYRPSALHRYTFVIRCSRMQSNTQSSPSWQELSAKVTVLVACRELAFQLADQFRALGSGMSFKVRDHALKPAPHSHGYILPHHVS